MSVDVGVDVEIDANAVWALTAKDCWASGAASKLALPASLASIVHVPAPMKLTVEPEIEQTDPLDASIVRETGRPEEAVADTA